MGQKKKGGGILQQAAKQCKVSCLIRKKLLTVYKRLLYAFRLGVDNTGSPHIRTALRARLTTDKNNSSCCREYTLIMKDF